MTTTKIITILFLLVILGFSWWRLFFKKKVKHLHFPKSWKKILLEGVPFYTRLKPKERNRFEQSILYFLDEITITGIETTVNDIDKILVAASAVIPLFGFPGWKYRNLNEVLLYEGSFDPQYKTKDAKGSNRNILGMVGSGEMNRMMILSKPALHEGFDNQWSKNNVGIHEFVHLLDKADGTIDGIPEQLISQPSVIPWVKLVHQKIKEMKARNNDINPYGATNEAEFLSVVSEYFFKQPKRLERKHPELFAWLEQIFRQDL